ncbi:MAG: NAD(P)/FAD-dependent oxidoreductase [Gammaproteobacteria bacterium]
MALYALLHRGARGLVQSSMTADFDCDALVIGAGPAGSATAILLAQAGWQVVLVEQHGYPRRKVCGECIGAGNLALLDRLGLGPAFAAEAGPELERLGWMDAKTTLSADMPRCTQGRHPFGRALGRERLDSLLLDRAVSLGVTIMQPARVLEVGCDLAGFACRVTSQSARRTHTLRMPVVVDAHGSWERGPVRIGAGKSDQEASAHRRRRNGDLLAFKANFRGARLDSGYLPVLALRGAYGGLVVADRGRLTLACCIRRDRLTALRRARPYATAGDAVEEFLRSSSSGVRDALDGAEREGTWLAVGPLRPGIRLGAVRGPFLVGNAAGECHPLIGEGISMALQSAAMLGELLIRRPPREIVGQHAVDLHRAYTAAWRRRFTPRLRLAAIFAHIAMRPALARAARGFLALRPALLGNAARLAGKAAGGTHPMSIAEHV